MTEKHSTSRAERQNETRSPEEMAPRIRPEEPSKEVETSPLGHRPRDEVDLETHQDDLGKRLYDASAPHLLSFKGSSRVGEVTGATIHLATLQRMSLHAQQAELTRIVSKIFRDKEATTATMDQAQDTLQKFANSLRDYDFMTEKKAEAARNGNPDPFEISTQNELGRYLLEPLIDRQLAQQNQQNRPDQPRLTRRLRRAVDAGKVRAGENILPGTPRGAANDAARLRLFVTALGTGMIGGIALILPTLIMVLTGGLVTTLVVSSAATLLFAGGLAFFTDMQPEGILGSVAAYAAVYVVFIGVTT